MIVTRDGRTYSCTLCRHHRRPCTEGLAVLEQLARSAGAAGAMAPDFEMQGCVRLQGCERGCTALFRLTPARLHLFCDLEPSDWTDELVGLAELLVGEAPGVWPARHRPEPAAMVVASAPLPAAAGLH